MQVCIRSMGDGLSDARRTNECCISGGLREMQVFRSGHQMRAGAQRTGRTFPSLQSRSCAHSCIACYPGWRWGSSSGFARGVSWRWEYLRTRSATPMERQPCHVFEACCLAALDGRRRLRSRYVLQSYHVHAFTDSVWRLIVHWSSHLSLSKYVVGILKSHTYRGFLWRAPLCPSDFFFSSHAVVGSEQACDFFRRCG